MRPIPKAKSLAFGAAFLVGLGLASCHDDTGAPGAVLPGRFAVAPAFVSANAGIIEIAQVRIILTRPDDESVALDTVVTVEPGTDEVDLTLTVPVFSSSEVFLMTVEFITPAGEVAFRGGPVEVTTTTDPTAPPVPVEVAAEYVGVGADAVEVRIICPAAPAAGASEGLAPSAVCPTNPTLLFGGTLDLTAEAFGPDGTQRPGAPIAWSALEPVRAAVVDPTVGQVSGGSERGPARIVAELLTGPADTIQLIVQPEPSSLAVVSGGGQTGSKNLQLPSPVVVELTAADALPVEGVTVDFQTLDGGSFTASSVVTDAAGRAQTNWTLGPALGTQNTTATVSGFGAVQATITAEAIVVPGTMTVFSGDGQTGPVTLQLPLPIIVEVTGADGLPAGGVTVDFQTPDGGSFSAASVVTDADGRAQTNWTLGPTVGTQSATATASGFLPSVTATIAATAVSLGKTLRWNTAASGNWGDPTKWDAGTVPGSKDIAIIDLPGIYTVTFAVGGSVDVLTLGGASGTQTLAIASNTLTINSSSTVGPTGTITVAAGATLTFKGSTHTVSSITGTGQVRFEGGTTTVSGTYNVGDLIVSGGNLDINGQTVTVSGNFSTAANGVLTMKNALGVLDVAGNVTFGGGSTDGTLIAGTLRTQGDFTQLANSNESFAASGTHEVVLNGTALQSVQFASPGGSGASHFANLEISNSIVSTGVQFETDAQIDGTIQIDATGPTVTSLAGVVVTAGGGIDEFFPGEMGMSDRWQVENTLFPNNSPLLPSEMTTNATFTGNATLSVFIIVNGNVTVADNGNISISGSFSPCCSAQVFGNFSTQGNGTLTTGSSAFPANDNLTVSGNVTFGGGSTAGLLVDGTLSVGGDFTQLGDPASFAPGGLGPTVVFGSTCTPQTISFADPVNSYFENLTVNNSAIVLASDVLVLGNVNQASSITESGGPHTLTVNGPFLDASSTACPGGINVGTLSVDGNLNFNADLALGTLRIGDQLTQGTGSYTVTNTVFTTIDAPQDIPPVTSYQNVEVDGCCDAEFTLSSMQTINGNLTVTNGTLRIGGANITVTGDFRTQNTGVLEMLNSADVLTVQVNTTFGGGNNAGLLTAGTINVKGNFTQSGNVESFHAGGSNTVDFNGTVAQTVTFTNPGIGVGAMVSHFANVAFNNASVGGVTLGSNVFAHSDLSSSSGSTAIINGQGNTLAVGGLNVSNVQLNNVLLIWNGTTSFPSFGTFTTFNNVVFSATYDPMVTQFSIIHPGAASAFNINSGITFNTAPSSGRHLKAEDEDGISDFLTINAFFFTSDCPADHTLAVNNAVIFYSCS